MTALAPEVTVVNEDNKIRGLDKRHQKTQVFQLNKMLDRTPQRKFYNEYIMDNIGMNSNDKKKLSQVNFSDFLPNSI